MFGYSLLCSNEQPAVDACNITQKLVSNTKRKKRSQSVHCVRELNNKYQNTLKGQASVINLFICLTALELDTHCALQRQKTTA